MNLRSSLLALLFVASCSPHYESSDKAADLYCACMKENGAPVKFEAAVKVCDAKLSENFEYYKLFYSDLENDYLKDRVSKEKKDSVNRFMLRFLQKIHSECCKETLACP